MLKALMLRKKINDLNRQLDGLRAKVAEFATREKELAQAIDEANTDEERSAVEEAVEAFEMEKRENEEQVNKLTEEVNGLEKELAEEEAEQDTDPEPEDNTRDREVRTMETREFFGLNAQERTAFFEDENVVSFLERVRQMGARRDAGDVTNANVLIPEVMLPLLRQEAYDTSRLVKHVNLQPVPGTARMPIDGGYPEAVWTEMCGKLNEVTIGFNDMEVDGYKVGAFMRVCNALLEDSDIALASEIISKLGQGIGFALDKAILYGTGTKMPLGIVTRLAQTAKPSDYSATARPWVDLHTSNIIKISATDTSGVTLFKKLVEAFGNASNKFSKGNRFWAMNETTKSKLIVEAMDVNANGAIVSGIGDTMPVIGGTIETLDFIPDNIIIAGYDNLYLLAQRAGVQFGTSEHVFFVEDQTAYKATARYDGAPAIAEGFVAIGISNTTVSATAVTFAEDKANQTTTSGD